MQLWELIGWVVGIIGTVGGAIFYLKFTATKANIDGKNETIKTQNDQIDALKEEVIRMSAEAQSYKKQAEALRDIAQQTPQIIDLTNAITQLTKTIHKQHTENIKERKEIAKILSNIVKKEVKKEGK